MSNYQLYQGDCLEIMKQIPDKSIDLILTDPPYGTTACKWDSVIPFEPMWEQLNRIIKPNGPIVLFGSQPFSATLICSNIKNFRYEIIWDKVNSSSGILAKKRPLKSHENILVFYKNQPNYYPQMTEGKQWHRAGKKEKKMPNVYGEEKTAIRKSNSDTTNLKYPKSIWTFSNADNTKRIHPTQKPVALLEYLIKTYTLEGETVLDFTMGSGSTGEACLRTNRNFIGIEIEEKYFNIAKERLEKVKEELEENM